MTAALEGGEWSAARPGRTLPREKPGTRYRRLGGPQRRSGGAENLVPTGIRSRTFQTVVSRYTDWATELVVYFAIICTQNHTVMLAQLLNAGTLRSFSLLVLPNLPHLVWSTRRRWVFAIPVRLGRSTLRINISYKKATNCHPIQPIWYAYWYRRLTFHPLKSVAITLFCGAPWFRGRITWVLKVHFLCKETGKYNLDNCKWISYFPSHLCAQLTLCLFSV